MKPLILLVFSFFVQCCYSQGYLIKILDVNKTSGSIKVNVYAQNFGEATDYLWNCYGYQYNCDPSRLNFFIEYDLYQNNAHVKLAPSSITVKTIFGGYVPMEQPEYYFPVTGSESGQYWNFVFPRPPNDAANVVISLYGLTRQIGDMPGAKEARIELEKNKKIAEEKIRVEQERLRAEDERLKPERARIKAENEKCRLESYNQALSTVSKGDEYFKANDYKNAISKYDEAIKTDITGAIYTECKRKLADSYFQLGKEHYKTKDFSQSSEYYKLAVKYNDTLKPQVSLAFASYKRKMNFFSCLPGIGQIQNNKVKRGVLLLGLASVGVGSSIAFYSESLSKYNLYMNSTNISEIPKLYNDAEFFRTASIFSGVFAGIVSFYSIIDANNLVLKHNKIWVLEEDKFSFVPIYLPNQNYMGFSLKMKF